MSRSSFVSTAQRAVHSEFQREESLAQLKIHSKSDTDLYLDIRTNLSQDVSAFHFRVDDGNGSHAYSFSPARKASQGSTQPKMCPELRVTKTGHPSDQPLRDRVVGSAPIRDSIRAHSSKQPPRPVVESAAPSIVPRRFRSSSRKASSAHLNATQLRPTQQMNHPIQRSQTSSRPGGGGGLASDFWTTTNECKKCPLQAKSRENFRERANVAFGQTGKAFSNLYPTKRSHWYR